MDKVYIVTAYDVSNGDSEILQVYKNRVDADAWKNTHEKQFNNENLKLHIMEKTIF